MGLNLACIVQHFLHGGAIPGHGVFPRGAIELSHHCLLPSSPSVPAQPSGSKVGDSSEERESLDDIDYHQLLKDYREVQTVLSLTKLNVKMLHGELDAARDTLHVSKNEAPQVRADWAIIKKQAHNMMNLLMELRTWVKTL
jgi:hypothetical protein